MKKYIVLCAGLCLALSMTSCKSSESAYKKAYEKAKQYDTQTAQQQTAQPATYEEPAVVAPVQTRPANEVRRVDNYDNVSVRSERVAVVSGNGLKAYSVVVGSFGLQSNAEGLQQRLKNAGYDAQIVKNEDRNMFRVVAATFDNKADAARSRDQFREQEAYKDAWLLSNQ
ncbi:MAG: SPOR domain-containing protein [Prevotella sp.]|nr:SPOR domain-containing protein [Prevotella sp.]